jgi:hypothetical protein
MQRFPSPDSGAAKDAQQGYLIFARMRTEK